MPPGVYLKAVNVNATVAGQNNTYEANGTAVAEMMTFEDFKLDFIKLYGNVRGTGTDFRWVGDLQAAAVGREGNDIRRAISERRHGRIKRS